MSANVYRGRADPAALLALIDRTRPDLLAVQELSPNFAAKLRRLGIERRLPHNIVEVEPGVTGAGVFSTYPLRRLPTPGPPNPRLQRVELELPPGERIRVVNVHPFTPTGAHADDWAGELESLPATGTAAPWLLAGDFNATIDHAVLRDVLGKGYRDAAEVTGDGLVPTWPNGRAFPPLIAIDHILADRRFGVGGFGVEGLLGTDHRAVIAQLFLR